METKATMSGAPLYTLKRPDGSLSVGDITHGRDHLCEKYKCPSWVGYSVVPCSLVEGHGRVVPVHLVEAIDTAYAAVCNADDEDECLDAHAILAAAIHAALGGAL